MSAADADTVVTQILRHLSRLVQQDIVGRTDMFVIDPARSVRIERAKVRMFLGLLTARAGQEIEEPDGRLRPAVEAAAAASEIEPAAAARLLGEILAEGSRLYRGEKVRHHQGPGEEGAQKSPPRRAAERTGFSRRSSSGRGSSSDRSGAGMAGETAYARARGNLGLLANSPIRTFPPDAPIRPGGFGPLDPGFSASPRLTRKPPCFTFLK